MKTITLLLSTIGLTSVLNAYSQSTPSAILEVGRAVSPIRIDGDLSDQAWANAKPADPFLNKWPLDTGKASHQTEVKILFDNDFIYISAINYQKSSDLIIQSLKRDQAQTFFAGDGFSVLLDPINQRSTGFLFGVNAGGAQMDAAVNLIGSWSRLNENWDNKWFSAVKIHDGFWIAEMAIPFTALRFNEQAKEWGLNLIRNDMKDNAFSTWSRVPLQFNGISLQHLGTLRWTEAITPKRSRATVIPYLSASNSRNFEDNEGADGIIAAGVDLKLAVSSSMNLDLTYKPDFSNVEVDRQMTNVTRFSLLYPERRNFFLENADLFTNFGSWLVRPFFSRRIGLYDGEPVPILAGARLSGNLTKGLRIGAMDIQTEATQELSANNYFVTAVQQQVFTTSSIKFFGANRQTTQAVEGDIEHDYNRTYGGEFQYISGDGKWNGYFRGHRADTPEKLSKREYLSAQVNFMNKKFYTGMLAERVGENYINDLGFIPRLHNYDPVGDTTVRIGHYAVNPWMGLMFYPKSRTINMIEPNTWSVVNYRISGEFLERNTSMNLMILFKDTRRLFLEAFNTSVDMPFSADLVDSENPIPNGKYDFTQYSIRYTSDTRKTFNYELNAGYGKFYNGTRLEYGASLNYRVQPWGLFALSYLQNDITLPAGYGSAKFQLVGPRAEVSLRNNIWFTTFLQYNTQQENFNINSRLQWRFKPMSDFFIVYSDNYATDSLKVKNRGLVVKLTYWLNL